MENNFTANDFESRVLKSDVPVLVDFYADWCGPCKMMAPVVEALAETFAGRVTVGKLNIDDNESIAAEYRVMTIPTLAVFKNGELVDKLIGVQPKETVQAMIEKNL
ncbi:MAG: thioredoxin [Lachnospiraceae bacterium]